VGNAEGWSRESGWQARRVERKLKESLLGEYAVSQLQFFADQALFVLDPVARFVPGACGAFDLSVQPSFEVTSVYRSFNGMWHIHAAGPRGAARREPWNRDSFRKAVEALRTFA
jgi:hypothetical protein